MWPALLHSSPTSPILRLRLCYSCWGSRGPCLAGPRRSCPVVIPASTQPRNPVASVRQGCCHSLCHAPIHAAPTLPSSTTFPVERVAFVRRIIRVYALAYSRTRTSPVLLRQASSALLACPLSLANAYRHQLPGRTRTSRTPQYIR